MLEKEIRELLYHRDSHERVTSVWNAVEAQYLDGLRGFTEHPLAMLVQQTKDFLRRSSEYPRHVFLCSQGSILPLEFAMPHKKTQLLSDIQRASQEDHARAFRNWWKQRVETNQDAEVIKVIASVHVLDWMELNKGYDYGFMDPRVYRSIQSYPLNRLLFIASQMQAFENRIVLDSLLTSIHMAVTEVFVSASYAPRDIFGSPVPQ